VVLPPLRDPSALDYDALFGRADVAAVLVSLPQADERTLTAYVGTIAPPVQARDIALILDGHPALVGPSGADGAHLRGIDAFSAAVTTLKPRHIAGVGGLRTRHDAMLAGERGADYVMFGDPNGDRPPLAAVAERVSWWAELFEVPCVGYAETIDAVTALVRAGADFVALGGFVLTDSSGPSAIIRAAAERLPRPDPVK
jgi:thiamine-phosphate pyrophosphorylase